jgi:hypothetical protein
MEGALETKGCYSKFFFLSRTLGKELIDVMKMKSI